MKTPGAIATDALTGYPLGQDVSREDVWQIVHDAIEADRAQREESAFSVGDPDPTPDFMEYGGWVCEACHADDYVCTWLEGHAGQHVAGDGEKILAVWS